jgi:hypothetical protein
MEEEDPVSQELIRNTVGVNKLEHAIKLVSLAIHDADFPLSVLIQLTKYSTKHENITLILLLVTMNLQKIALELAIHLHVKSVEGKPHLTDIIQEMTAHFWSN